MADGLLLTRSERLRAFWSKAGLALLPSAGLALAAVLVGAPAVGVAVVSVAALAALVAGQSARTPRGALAAGVVLAVLLFLLQLALAWLITHPVIPP